MREVIARIVDGHDPEQLHDVFRELNVVKNGHRPLAVIARTVKGWGAPSEQGMGHHGTPVKKDKLQAIYAELDKTAAGVGATDFKADGELNERLR